MFWWEELNVFVDDLFGDCVFFSKLKGDELWFGDEYDGFVFLFDNMRDTLIDLVAMAPR